jgi:hypothetical protein
MYHLATLLKTLKDPPFVYHRNFVLARINRFPRPVFRHFGAKFKSGARQKRRRTKRRRRNVGASSAERRDGPTASHLAGVDFIKQYQPKLTDKT